MISAAVGECLRSQDSLPMRHQDLPLVRSQTLGEHVGRYQKPVPLHATVNVSPAQGTTRRHDHRRARSTYLMNSR